jgi:CheY-specific phosphatase CheX
MKTTLTILKKHFFTILGISGLIAGNIICLIVNDRLLKLPTNLIGCFIILSFFLKNRK